MHKFIAFSLQYIRKFQVLDFIPLLAIRIYLIPVLLIGAKSKILHFPETVAWLGGPLSEGGLALPFPTLMAILASATEAGGALLLGLGLATRLISFQLIIFMCVAGLTVHWVHGWSVIATKTAESTLRLDAFMQWLAANFPARYNYVTELGDPVMLNNGVEFTVTYIIMLFVLLFFGGGRFVSLDYWINRHYQKK